MSLEHYGLLKCKIINAKEERDSDRPHYNIHVRAQKQDYRISVNIKSDADPSELLYYTNLDFKHAVTEKIEKLPYGFHTNKDIAMDYIRGELGFNKEDMQKLPYDLPGPNNDINEKLTQLMLQAELEQSDLYIFGSKWEGEDPDKPDRIFGFLPSMGIHDVHMNQGNIKKWSKDDGVWQDGGILIHYLQKNQWVGIFLAFQSQSWNNDDLTGHAKAIRKYLGGRHFKGTR